MYVVDAGEPGSEGANDAAVVRHEGFPWSFWFPDPYPSPGICDAVKTAAPGMTVISGNVQVHDNKQARTTGRLRRGRPSPGALQPTTDPEAVLRGRPLPLQARSKRSRFMTLFHASTKSQTNFPSASALP